MKRAIVIGASSGIGKELSRVLVKNNYIVGVTGRRGKLLEDLKKENTDSFIVQVFDVKDTDNVSSNLDCLVKKLGGLDLFVVCAGSIEVNNNLDFELEKSVIDVNVSGFTSLVDWGFNFFKSQKSGHIVALSSISGLRGNRLVPCYSASKAYQINYLEGLRLRVGVDENIFITDVCPGLVDTPMQKSGDTFWMVSAEKAAGQIFKAIDQKKEFVYVSKRWRFIAWFFNLVPWWLYKRM